MPKSISKQSNFSGWGFAVLSATLAAATPARAADEPKLRVLYSFNATDGSLPSGDLIGDRSGNLYGTTKQGGGVFKLSPSGSYTVLHSFSGTDGSDPAGGLSADSAGNLYGATFWGGTAGLGVVFKLAPNGTYTVLHSFRGIEGAHPEAGPIVDDTGNLYGTAAFGARSARLCGGLGGCGVVFKLSRRGIYTILHSFNGRDGANPTARLIADRDGNLYGTTNGGGSAACGTFGCGVVFKLSPTGAYRVLHFFKGDDGDAPEAGLMADSKGNLYGTTYAGGASGSGVVFKIARDGTYKVLHSFCSLDGCPDGGFPVADLITDGTGNLYGTTNGGGTSGNGVVFELVQDGTYKVLHTFSGGRDGAYPEAGLIADRSGNLYGTASEGGATQCPVTIDISVGCGVVFKLRGTEFTPAMPFAAIDPARGSPLGMKPNADASELR